MKNLFYGLILVAIISLFSTCNTNVLPKPKAFLSLKYPAASYHKISDNCPYQFEISNQAKLIEKNKCWAIIEYPKLKATMYITYRKANNNLDDILNEAEKFTFKHAKKANGITDIAYINYEKKVFAKLYNVEGNVASNIQFRATDSIKNVLAGALYFYVEPNYDSILPAIKYIEKDVTHLIETLSWKNEK
ncbi:gliding motility lipoprotein GldD [Lutibacter sp.]|uniref:gliding motility lipoprotein GldD n=1 Tax=Lutibacter sp. TaxID=1925666 RepID=UPI0025C451BD|nr:gliding motility lipoprotein GldD [Lutibacter sp.]MCF6181209.1 gliding motility lipoprotein GldD [Lutibacter sp.]